MTGTNAKTEALKAHTKDLEAQLTRAWATYGRWANIKTAVRIRELTEAILYAKRR